MTAAQIVERLTHHHIESAKCVFDAHRFRCDCGLRILLENIHFTGRTPARCRCGLIWRIDFAAAAAEAGPVNEMDGDPWGCGPVK